MPCRDDRHGQEDCRGMVRCSLDGVSPQRAIRILADLVNRTPQADKRWLRIEAYDETYSNPFCQNPTRCLRIVLDKPEKLG